MRVIDRLRDEHEEIEWELSELEVIRDAGELNFPNLIHTFTKLCAVWNAHEESEEKIFGMLERDRIKMPVEKMVFEHNLLRPHREKMFDAISSRDEFRIKKSLDENLPVILKILRKHMDSEDEVLFTISEEEFSDEELEELRSVD